MAPGDSHAWKHLTQIRNKVENNIRGCINEGNNSFWWDNWSGKDALADHFPHKRHTKSILVKDFIRDGQWNI